MLRKAACREARALCALLAALPALTHAATLIQRGPIDEPNNVQSILGSGYMEWNLAEEMPFESERGVKLTTKVAADDSTGVIRVYAGSDTRGVSGIPDVFIAHALGQVSSTAVTLVGSGTDPVPVSFQFAFDGSFLTHSGSSFHHLGSSMAVAVPSTFVPITYQVDMNFRSLANDAGPISVDTRSEMSYLNSDFQYVTEAYAGGSGTVLSQTMEEVAGLVRLHVMILPGQSFEFAVNLFAQSYSMPLTTTTGTADYSQSAGAVDALHTGTLAIVLPAGYSLTSDAEMFTNAVVPAVTPVPEPRVYALLAAGLGTVLAMTRRRRSMRH